MDIFNKYLKTKHYVAAAQRRGVSDEDASIVLSYGLELRQGVYLMSDEVVRELLGELRLSVDQISTAFMKRVDALRGLVVVTVRDSDGLLRLVTAFWKTSANGSLRTPSRRDPHVKLRARRLHAAKRRAI